MKKESKLLTAIICMAVMLLPGVRFASGADEIAKDVMAKEGSTMWRAEAIWNPEAV